MALSNVFTSGSKKRIMAASGLVLLVGGAVTAAVIGSGGAANHEVAVRSTPHASMVETPIASQTPEPIVVNPTATASPAIDVSATATAPAPTHMATPTSTPAPTPTPLYVTMPTPTPTPSFHLPPLPPLAPLAITGISISVNPPDNCTPVPDYGWRTITFTGTISDTPGFLGGLITYHWVRSDGQSSLDQTTRIATGQTTATVSQTWDFMPPSFFPTQSYWEQLVITSPGSHSSSEGIYRAEIC